MKKKMHMFSWRSMEIQHQPYLGSGDSQNASTIILLKPKQFVGVILTSVNTQDSSFGPMEPLDKFLWELKSVEKLMKETTGVFLPTDLERGSTSSNSLSPVSKD